MKPPAFQFYPDDFLSGTMMMTNGEVGLYIRLLCLQWSKGYVSESDARAMAKLYSCPDCDLEKVLEKFEKVDGLLKNPRMEEERVKQEVYRKERAESGAKGAKARWGDAGNNGSLLAHPVEGEKKTKSPPSQTVKGFVATIDKEPVTHPPSLPRHYPVIDPSPATEPPDDDCPFTATLEEMAAPSLVPDQAGKDKKVLPTKPRNELFDALIRVNGVPEPPSGKWGPRSGQTAKALQTIKEVQPNLTVEDIHRMEANFRKIYPGANVTPTALSNHAAELLGGTVVKKHTKNRIM